MIIKIPEDIDSYIPKTWGNFTTRQFISLLLAFPIISVIFVGLYFLTADATLSGIIAIIIASPIFLSGFAKTQGIYFNEIIKRRLEDKKYSIPRKYVSQNIFSDLNKLEKIIQDYENTEREINQNEKKTKNIFKKKIK